MVIGEGDGQMQAGRYVYPLQGEADSGYLQLDASAVSHTGTAGCKRDQCDRIVSSSACSYRADALARVAESHGSTCLAPSSFE